jgi:hypothetical protein
MDGAVDTGVHVVRVDQAGEKGDAIWPTALIKKSGPDSGGRLEVRRRMAEAGDENDDKGEEGKEDCSRKPSVPHISGVSKCDREKG